MCILVFLVLSKMKKRRKTLLVNELVASFQLLFTEPNNVLPINNDLNGDIGELLLQLLNCGTTEKQNHPLSLIIGF